MTRKNPYSVLIFVAIAAPQLALALAYLSLDQTSIDLISLCAAIGAAALAVLSPGWRTPHRAGAPILVAMPVLIVGFVVGTQTLPLVQVLQGARVLILPILAAVVGLGLKFGEMRSVVRALSFVLFLSFLASVVEYAIGTDALVRLGWQYGTTVRTYDGVLRAPGLALTNYDFGSFAGVFAAVCWLWWLPAESTTRWRFWACASGIFAALALVTTAYRTGILVLAVAMVVSALFRMTVRTSSRLWGLLLVAAVTWWIGQRGLLSTDSLVARGSTWDTLLGSGLNLVGNGIGSVGAASGSSYSAARIVTDNFFLSLIMQFGLGGMIGVMMILAWGVRLLVRSRASDRLAGGFVLFGCIVAFWFVEFWEYSSAMMLAMLISAQGYSESSASIRTARARQLGSISTHSVTRVGAR